MQIFIAFLDFAYFLFDFIQYLKVVEIEFLHVIAPVVATVAAPCRGFSRLCVATVLSELDVLAQRLVDVVCTDVKLVQLLSKRAEPSGGS